MFVRSGKIFTAGAALVLGIAPALLAQRPRERTPWPPDHPGPWDNALSLAVSEDGLDFRPLKRRLVERGGVPHLVSLGGKRVLAVFQWFPFDRREAFDRIAVMLSEDGGESWEGPEPARFDGLPAAHRRPCDPTLVRLPDGRLRLYTTGGPEGPSEPCTWSAVSAAAPAGAALAELARFRFEPEPRFARPGEAVLDCAVIRHDGKWHYLAPVQRRRPPRPGGAPERPGPPDFSRAEAYHAVSEDGLDFRELERVRIEGMDFLGAAVAAPDGLRFYGTGPGGVRSALSKDGERWEMEPGVRIERGADPGVARLEDGRWLMLYTGMGSRRTPPPPPRPRSS